MRKKENYYIYIITYIAGWFILNTVFLDVFPFFHSDEIWLAGLTRTMLEAGSPNLTEPFFDLFPRTVHGLKLIFHGFQAPFILLSGYTPSGIRMLSLVCGAAGLFLFFRMLRKAGVECFFSFLGTVLLSLDIQFIYASHFGRQEALLLLFMMIGVNVSIGKDPGIQGGRSGNAAAAGLLTGGALGIHPNAFITAWPISLFFLISVIRKRRKPADGIIFLAAAGTGAGLFIGLSLLMNPDFFREYMAFGRTVGVREGILERFADFPAFLQKLFLKISGTYYTPDIRPQIILLPITTAAGIYIARKDDIRFGAGMLGICGISGITAGLIIIGKYSQPSFVFYIPFIHILLAALLNRLSDNVKEKIPDGSLIRYSRYIFPVIMIIVFISVSVTQIYREVKREKNAFKDYNFAIDNIIPEGSKVLANINAGLGLKNSEFRDWRNLGFIAEQGLSPEEYIRTRKIDFIIYPEELDYIYQTRPVWNIMYGNIYLWFEDLKNFIEQECEHTEGFSSPGYGMRIVPLRYSKEWRVDIYRVLPLSSSE